MDITRAKRLVKQYTAARDEAVIAATAKRMVERDECVWHAFAQVAQKPCWCADCER